jgi:hypothetical protein
MEEAFEAEDENQMDIVINTIETKANEMEAEVVA